MFSFLCSNLSHPIESQWFFVVCAPLLDPIKQTYMHTLLTAYLDSPFLFCHCWIGRFVWTSPSVLGRPVLVRTLLARQRVLQVPRHVVHLQSSSRHWCCRYVSILSYTFKPFHMAPNRDEHSQSESVFPDSQNMQCGYTIEIETQRGPTFFSFVLFTVMWGKSLLAT